VYIRRVFTFFLSLKNKILTHLHLTEVKVDAFQSTSRWCSDFRPLLSDKFWMNANNSLGSTLCVFFNQFHVAMLLKKFDSRFNFTAAVQLRPISSLDILSGVEAVM
jgi:hypothetical protein